jgi:hypothetical protein
MALRSRSKSHFFSDSGFDVPAFEKAEGEAIERDQIQRALPGSITDQKLIV